MVHESWVLRWTEGLPAVSAVAAGDGVVAADPKGVPEPGGTWPGFWRDEE